MKSSGSNSCPALMSYLFFSLFCKKKKKNYFCGCLGCCLNYRDQLWREFSASLLHVASKFLSRDQSLPPALQEGFLTTRPPGKSHLSFSLTGGVRRSLVESQAFYFLIEVQSTYNIILVSDIQHSDTFDTFMDYTPYKVIIKYELYSPGCILYPCNLLILYSFIPFLYLAPPHHFLPTCNH